MFELPDGVVTVVAFLSLGYLLFVVELVVPGGVLGVLGGISVLYGCWEAFQLGVGWGSASIVASLAFFFLAIRFLMHSRTGKALALDDGEEAKTWKSNREEWRQLVGQVGTTLSPLRPAGVALFDGERYDVVSDSEFLPADLPVRVIEVEGRRIVVESVEAPTEPRRPASDD